MADRMELHKKLLSFGMPVYYSPPESARLIYPCIVYYRDYIKADKADDLNYMLNNRYQLTVIDRNVDNPVIWKILEMFPMSSFDRHYFSEGLNHDVLSVYY